MEIITSCAAGIARQHFDMTVFADSAVVLAANGDRRGTALAWVTHPPRVRLRV